jgi:hypothetical protein
MNKIQSAAAVLLTVCAALLFSIGALAQNGRGGARPGNFYFRGGINLHRNYFSAGIGSRAGYHNYNRGYYGYRPVYSNGFRYDRFPRYSYRPVYRSPYVYHHFGPAFGIRLGILPVGYYPFYLGPNPYYYYNGVYYRPYRDGGYEVTPPPLGAAVKHLPSGAKATVINGQKYYELGGTFYQPQTDAKNKLSYVVVGTDGVINTVDQNQPPVMPDEQNTPDVLPPQPPVPAAINQLPANSKVVIINQQKLYLTPSGIYYKEVIDADNNVSYQVADSNDKGTGTYQ